MRKQRVNVNNKVMRCSRGGGVSTQDGLHLNFNKLDMDKMECFR